jgi:cytochrome c-type biogenesis protein CcsB
MRFSPIELLEESYLLQYANSLGSESSQVPNLSGGIAKQDPRRKELRSVLDRLQSYRAFAAGDAWLVVPRPAPDKWSTLVGSEPEGEAVRGAFGKLVEAYRAGDRAAFETAATEARALVVGVLGSVGGSRGSEPAGAVLTAEYWYNRTHPFYYGWILFLVAAVAWTVSLTLGAAGAAQDPGTAAGPRKKGARWGALALASTALGSVALVAGIVLRVIIAGRPPVSNMYESIIWVAFGVMLFGVAIYRSQRQPVVLAVATAVASLCLIAADAAPAIMDPGIHPLVPVLRSNTWLLVHVLTITLSYSALALTMGLGNVALWQFVRKARDARAPGVTARIATLNQLNYRAMQFGVVLLAAGIILGGVWADYSWGRFWGWDPKEVWALIALLGYVAILHARYVAWVGQFGYAAWTVLSFLLVVMAWYGVNFVLGVGLHSYGFSTGGRGVVALFCGLQLAYVGWVAWLHSRRGGRKQAGAAAE